MLTHSSHQEMQSNLELSSPAGYSVAGSSQPVAGIALNSDYRFTVFTLIWLACVVVNMKYSMPHRHLNRCLHRHLNQLHWYRMWM